MLQAASQNTPFEKLTAKSQRNPFLGLMLMDIQMKDRMTMRTERKEEINPDTGEVTERNTYRAISEPQEIKRFVKTFAAFWKQYAYISQTAASVLCVLMEDYNESRFKDRIYMSHRAAVEEFDYQNKYRTWLKGINELVEKKFIARDPLETNWYFVNGCMMFKGNRWKFIQENIKEQT